MGLKRSKVVSYSRVTQAFLEKRKNMFKIAEIMQGHLIFFHITKLSACKSFLYDCVKKCACPVMD